MTVKGRREDQVAVAFWLTRLAYHWQREAETCYNEFRYAEAALLMHEGIEFTVKALCRQLNVEFPKEHFPAMDTLVSLSERVEAERQGARDVVLKAAPLLLGYNDAKRNMARYGYEGSHHSSLSPTRVFGDSYCEAARRVLVPLTQLLTEVQVDARWSPPAVRIGVLDARLSRDSSPCEPRWSNACPSKPEEWQSVLGAGYVVNQVTVSDLDDDLAVLVNPFGEGYPESDLARRSCCRRILSFIEEGGVLVSSAGLPFFAAWKAKDGGYEEISDTHAWLPGRLAVSGGVVVSAEWKRLLSLDGTIAARELGVFTTLDDGGHKEPLTLPIRETDAGLRALGNIAGMPSDYAVFRPAKDFPQGSTPVLIADHPSLGPVYPMVIVPKGRGCVVVSGLNLSDERSSALFQSCVRAICDSKRKIQKGEPGPTSPTWSLP